MKALTRESSNRIEEKRQPKIVRKCNCHDLGPE